MKKIFALFLCLALLLSCTAFAESLPEEQKESIGVIGVENAFNIKCRMPEGYKVNILSSDDTSIYAEVICEDETKPMLNVGIAYNDTYFQDGKALRLNDLSEEEKALIRDSLVDMLSEYEIGEQETAYGTELLVVKGRILNTTVVEFFSVYNAYEVTVIVMPGKADEDGRLTDEQVEMIVGFLSDMDFDPVVKAAD